MKKSVMELLQEKRATEINGPYDEGYNYGLTVAAATIFLHDCQPVVRCEKCIYRNTRTSCQGRPLDFFCADGKGRR